MLKHVLNQLDLKNKTLSEMGEIVSRRKYPLENSTEPEKKPIKRLKKSLQNNFVKRKAYL